MKGVVLQISIIGAGYVGLVSGVCFAELGFSVTCIDSNDQRIAQMRQGVSPIYEPGLDELLVKNIAAGRMKFANAIDAAVGKADFLFIAVGTPMSDSGEADLSQIFAAAEQCAPFLDGYTIVVLKSTVPVGTNQAVETRLRALRPDADFDVCSNPEFLREGSAIRDFMEPDRVLVGAESQRASALMSELYRPLAERGVPVLFVSRESSEMAKYAANAFLAMKITFINEVSDICEKLGGKISEVAKAIGLDNRIGGKFLNPGPGFGGSCFPKDLAALVYQSRQAGVPMTLAEQVQRVNEDRKRAMAGRIERAGGGIAGKTVAVLGVTFKPDTDDMRDAPSLAIIPLLLEKGARVIAYDPAGQENAESLLPGVSWSSSAQDAYSGADIVVVLTEWSEFGAIVLSDMKRAMKGDVLVDLRNVFTAANAAAAGLAYSGIGHKQSD